MDSPPPPAEIGLRYEPFTNELYQHLNQAIIVFSSVGIEVHKTHNGGLVEISFASVNIARAPRVCFPERFENLVVQNSLINFLTDSMCCKMSRN